jgi:predicted outer membrane lipoprotein
MNKSELLGFIGWLVLGILALAGAAILSYWAPWYFAWVVGTAMIILIAAFAGVLYDRQALEHGENDENPEA